MSIQSSYVSASRPGVFVEAVSLAARASHREPSTWVTKPKSGNPRFRSVVAGLSVAVAILGTTLLMVA